MRKDKITDILTFLSRCKSLESNKRYGSSLLKDKRNSVAEHSWRLSMMAIVIVTECNIEVDMKKVLELCTLHDLAEATTGDIDAYEQIINGKKLVEEKAVMEDKAVNEMTNDIMFGDWIYKLWREYEDQKTIESKFVKAIDRIEGFLHIAEVGVENYIPKEFHSDYADKAVRSFDETTEDFPGMKDFLDAIKANLKEQFEKIGVIWLEKKSA